MTFAAGAFDHRPEQHDGNHAAGRRIITRTSATSPVGASDSIARSIVPTASYASLPIADGPRAPQLQSRPFSAPNLTSNDDDAV